MPGPTTASFLEDVADADDPAAAAVLVAEPPFPVWPANPSSVDRPSDPPAAESVDVGPLVSPPRPPLPELAAAAPLSVVVAEAVAGDPEPLPVLLPYMSTPSSPLELLGLTLGVGAGCVLLNADHEARTSLGMGAMVKEFSLHDEAH